MRFLHFLALVVQTSAAGICGIGPVDLSGVKPFDISIGCPANKNAANIEIGCVTKAKKDGTKSATQKSNTFYVNPCGKYKTQVKECQDTLESFPESAGYQVTEDFDENGGPLITTCYSIGSSAAPAPVFSLLGEHLIIPL